MRCRFSHTPVCVYLQSVNNSVSFQYGGYEMQVLVTLQSVSPHSQLIILCSLCVSVWSGIRCRF